MASNLLIYATRADFDLLRTWINGSGDVAWITKVRELEGRYVWRAVRTLESIEQKTYAVWHVASGPLYIPSGSPNVPDTLIQDPFAGWTQSLSQEGLDAPWFGGNLPGPYRLTFAEDGCEAPGNLARSDFCWQGDYYKSIGMAAHPAAKSWWAKLERYIKRSASAVPWVDALSNRKVIPKAYVFPDAERQLHGGRKRDVNPWSPNRVAQAPA